MLTLIGHPTTRPVRRRRGLLAALALGWATLAGSAHAGSADKVLIGYYLPENSQLQAGPGYAGSGVSARQAGMLSHLDFAFLELDEHGACALPAGSDARAVAALLAQLRSLRRAHPRLRLMFSLGGWAQTNDDSATVARYRQAAATPAARRRLAASCVALVQRYGFDGIDIDWEYPRAQDADHFVALLAELRTQLDAQGRGRRPRYQLTIAAAGGAFNLARTYRQLPHIAAQVDYINLMTYDLNGPWQPRTDHNAALFGGPGETLYDNPLPGPQAGRPFALTADAAVQQYLQAGVPAAKLVLGLPFYGRAYFAVQAQEQGLHQRFVTQAGDDYRGDLSLLAGCAACAKRGDPRLPAYRDIVQLLQQPWGYVRHFSEAAKVPWLYNAQRQIFVSYDDAVSLRYKAAYLRRQGLAGAMFWHLTQDDDQATLLSTLHRCLHGKDDCSAGLDDGGGLHYQRP